jgi:hypothetical protein
MKRLTNAAMSGVPPIYGSSTEPMLAVAPLASKGPTQFRVVERRVEALNEKRW